MAMRVQGGRMVPTGGSSEDRRDLASIQKSLADAKKAMNSASSALNKALQRGGGRGAFAAIDRRIVYRMNNAQQAIYWLENELASLRLQ